MSTTNISCNGGNNGTATVTASGGTPSYTYLWNDPSSQTTQMATGLGAGPYGVIVTDAVGATTAISGLINEPSAISTTIATNEPSCPGSANGSASVSVLGGVLSYTYQWPTGSTTTNGYGLPAGDHTMTVTDGAGCTKVDTFTITEPAPLIITPTTYGGDSATVFATGGTSPYSYLWNDANNQTTQTATGLNSGSYVVIVSDFNGCTTNSSILITNVTSIANTNQINIQPNPNTGQFNIQADLERPEAVQIRVFNAIGQKLWEKNTTGQQIREHIDLKGQGSGLYLVLLQTKEQTYRQKILIRK